MSYILDALRRADAERERGSVPGIHAQQTPLGPAEAARRPAAKPWGWIAAALALALGGALAWRLLGDSAAPVPAPPAATAPPQAAAPWPAAPLPAPVLASPPKAAMVAHPAPTAASSSAAAPAERVYAQHELPDDIRRQLPTLTVGGSMYSDEPARRMLIINGQIYHEHDQLAPELTLEQIKLKAAVLKYKTYRYSISF